MRRSFIAGDTTVYDYSGASWNPTYTKDLTTGTVTDLVFAGGLRIGKVQAGVNNYYHLDRLGSVRLVTQTMNLQTFTAKYLPYGNTYATTGTESFQYTGKQLDVSTGLSYYGYRYYDDQSGRFMSLDPHQPSYMNPQSLSGYIYALDNPFRYTDPTGALPQNELFTPKAKKEQQQQDEEDRIDREKYEKLREVINRMLDDSGVSGVGTFTYEFKTVSRGAIETTYISINGLECSITSTGKSVTTLESTAIVTSAGFQIASTDTTYSIGGTSTITTITTWEATTSVTTVSTTTNEETTATTTWTGQGWNPSMGPGPQGEVPGCFVAGVDAAVGFGGMAQYGMYDKNTLDFLARFMGWCFG